MVEDHTLESRENINKTDGDVFPYLSVWLPARLFGQSPISVTECLTDWQVSDALSFPCLFNSNFFRQI